MSSKSLLNCHEVYEDHSLSTQMPGHSPLLHPAMIHVGKGYETLLKPNTGVSTYQDIRTVTVSEAGAQLDILSEHSCVP